MKAARNASSEQPTQTGLADQGRKIREICGGHADAGEGCTVKFCPGKITCGAVSGIKGRAGKIRVLEVCGDDFGSAKRRASEVGAGEVRAEEGEGIVR